MPGGSKGEHQRGGEGVGWQPFRSNYKESDIVKLRIRDNSVRLRLMRGEVDTLHDKGIVEAGISFPGGRALRYLVESSPAIVNPAAFFSENEIIVRLPEATVLAWATTEQVSIEGEQVLDDGAKLSILIEKDFVCLTGRDEEDESDMYPHPEADSGTC